LETKRCTCPSVRNARPKTFERSLKEKARTVEDELPFDTDFELAPVLFELPRIQAAAMGPQAQVKAVVARPPTLQLRE
jgi:hypothetical protein